MYALNVIYVSSRSIYHTVSLTDGIMHQIIRYSGEASKQNTSKQKKRWMNEHKSVKSLLVFCNCLLKEEIKVWIVL